MHNGIRQVALVGLGGIGCFVAPRLQALLGDAGFFVVADGARKQRLAQGVLINGQRHLFRVERPAACTPVDLVIIATKNMQLAAALQDIQGCVAPGTLVLSLLNGIDSEETIASTYPQATLLHSLIKVPATNENGAITVPMQKGRIIFGDTACPGSPAEQALAALLSQADIPHTVSADIRWAMWEKFMCNVSENQLAAVLRLNYGGFQTSQAAETLRIAVCQEVAAVAKTQGVHLTDADIAARGNYLQTLRPEGKPSTLQDIEAGRKTEVESFSGKVLQLAAAHHIDTPYCRFLYHAIQALEQQPQ